MKPDHYVPNETPISLHPGGLSLTRFSAGAAGMQPGETVLDIGCGTGASLLLLQEEFGSIPYGIDRSEEALRRIRNCNPSLNVSAADMLRLPCEDMSFDHVLMECVLTLSEDPAAALAEAVRVLRPGGKLIISTLTRSSVDTEPVRPDKGSIHKVPDRSETDRNNVIRSICSDGLVLLPQLEQYLKELGLSLVHLEDRTRDLTQYMIDAVMYNGSPEERIRQEAAQAGISPEAVFGCSGGTLPDFKTTGYYLAVFKKETGDGSLSPWENRMLCETGSEGRQRTVPCLQIPCLPGTPVDQLVAQRIGVRPADLTNQAVESYQVDAFRRTVRYARDHSRFYGNLLRETDPDKIRSMEDIKTIPTSGESDLAGNEWQFQCVSASETGRNVTVPVLSSGTGGSRKRISYAPEDQERAVEFINRGFLTMGCREGEKMIVFMSGTTPGSIGDLVARAMAPLKMDTLVCGAVTDIAEAYEKVMEFRPDVVEAIPWHAAALARYGSRYGNPEKEFIRSVNLSADVVPDSIVRRLEELWKCSVHRHYGTTEMAIFGGVECIHHQGYHTRPCDILYEIPETDEKGYGELLITTLDRRSMPLIRYRTGDIARFIDTPCPCGCRIRRIEKILGRQSSRVQFPEGSFYLSELADLLYRIPEVTDFDLRIVRSSSGDKMLLTVRTLPGDKIEESAVRKTLLSLVPACGRPLFSDTKTEILIEESPSFPSGYNLKKKLMK